MVKLPKQLSIWQILLIAGDFLLLGVLSMNGWRLYQTYIRYKDILTGNLLTDHPEEFIDKIIASGVPAWVWVVEIGALVITAVLLVGWMVPKMRSLKSFTWLNVAWLLAWLGYFVFLVVMATVVVGSLISFT